MGKKDQDSLVSWLILHVTALLFRFMIALGTQLHMAAHGQSQPVFKLLNQKVGQKCFYVMLGIGKNRMAKAKAAVVDGRFGKVKTGSRRATMSVDVFLLQKWSTVAETLPHELLG